MAKRIKTGGREQGTPNKVSRDIKEAFKIIIESNIDNLSIWLGMVAEKHPERAAQLIINMAEFVTPKAKTEFELSTPFPSKIEHFYIPIDKKIANSEAEVIEREGL